MNLLYICEMNTDRSTIAKFLTENKNTNLHVDSAGLIDPLYMGLAPEMEEALIRLKFTLPIHQAKKATTELLEKQDLILCMEKWHVDEISYALRFGLEQKARVYTLLQYISTLPGYTKFKDKEIKDPGQRIKDMDPWSFPKRFFYRKLLDYISADDFEGVVNLYINLIKRINSYVNLAVKKMREENLILKNAEGGI